MYLYNHVDYRYVLRSLCILIEDTSANEQKGNEETKHEEVLDAKKSLIDSHSYSVPAKHKN